MRKVVKCPLINAVCPQNNDPSRGAYCPTWWEASLVNVQTGETALRKECGWSLLPVFLIEVIKASNRPAAAIESTRNEIAEGLARVTQSVYNAGIRGLPKH